MFAAAARWNRNRAMSSEKPLLNVKRGLTPFMWVGANGR